MAREDPNTLETLAAARRVLHSTLEQISDDDWPRPTPCEAWTVREVVDHLIIGEATVPPWLGAEPLTIGQDAIQEDPVGAWVSLAAAADDAFAVPGALEAPVDHPFVGQITGEVLAWFRIVDNAIHGWDLARSVGADQVLPDPLLTALSARAMEAAVPPAETGLFAAPPTLASDADRQTRLLAHFGRSASWKPG